MGTASLETWSEPITEIQQEFQMSLDYPDIYMCLPDTFVKTYSDEDSTNAYYSWAGFSTTSYEAFKKDEACDLNEHRGSFIKVDPLSMKPFGSDPSRTSYVAADDPGSCPVKKPKPNIVSAGAPEDSASHMRIGCPRGELSDDDCDNWVDQLEGHADPTKLVSLMPSVAVESDPSSTDVGGDDTCAWPRDGECDVDSGICTPGTDCSDCPDDEFCEGDADDGNAGDGNAGGGEACEDIVQGQDCDAIEDCTWHPDDPACLPRECDDIVEGQQCGEVDGCTWDGSECRGDRRRMQTSVAGAYEPLCLKYEMKPGSKQYYDEKRKYFLAMQQEVDEVDKSGPYWIMYLAEAGTAPYHCNNMEKDGNELCKINATAIFFPGMPSVSIAMLSVEYIKDLREDSEAAFVPIYKYNMWNKMSIDHESGDIELTRGIMGFQYGAPRTMPSIVRYRSNVEAGLTTIVNAFERQRVSLRALSRSATSVRARFWPSSAACGPLQRPSLPSFGPIAAISIGRGAVR